MSSIYEVPTKRLFVAATVIKIASSLATLFVDGTGLWFWIFALIIPILTMTIYVYVGINRTDRHLTDLKFADSCYYLGFLFTITAIAIGLIDVGKSEVSMEALAWRFGVAMVSTVIGMGVRIFLVNFKVEADDAVHIVEDALIHGAQSFTHNLAQAVERYKMFEIEVNTSTNQVIENINQRLAKLTEDHTTKLNDHFQNLTNKTETLVSESLTNINNAGIAVAETASLTKGGINTVMIAFESELDSFKNSLRCKLDELILPDDFFASKLNPALDSLINSIQIHQTVISHSSESVTKVTEEMTNALAAMNRRAVATGKVLETLEKTAADGRDLTEAVRETSENFKIALNTLIESSNKSPTQESMIEQSAKIIEKLDQNQNILQTALGRLELLENQAEITVLTEIKSICDAIQKLDLSITSAVLEYGKNGNQSLLEISEQFKVSMGAQTQAILDLKQSLRAYPEQIKQSGN